MATITWFSWLLVAILSIACVYLWFEVKKAYVDALTGLSNRRAFNKAFERELERAQRGFTPLSALFIDVDHFKSVNDGLGHRAGDKLLRHIAEALHGALPRRADSLFRYGGEEFIVLLPGTPKFGARKKAEEVITAVRKASGIIVNDSAPAVLKRSVSIGVTTLLERESSEVFLERVINAMKHAKAAGRDTIVEL